MSCRQKASYNLPSAGNVRNTQDTKMGFLSRERPACAQEPFGECPTIPELALGLDYVLGIPSLLTVTLGKSTHLSEPVFSLVKWGQGHLPVRSVVRPKLGYTGNERGSASGTR